MTFLKSINEVIDYLSQPAPPPEPVVLVFHSSEEYYDFLNQYYDTDTFFRKHYDFGEEMRDILIHNYCPLGICLSYPTEDPIGNWSYCGYDYFKTHTYKVFAIYSEMYNVARERISIATTQEVDSFLLGD